MNFQKKSNLCSNHWLRAVLWMEKPQVKIFIPVVFFSFTILAKESFYDCDENVVFY
jgi:hypothetical protein